jgi:hypothetical protein
MFIYLIVNHETGKYYVGQHKGENLKKYLQTKFSDARHGRGGNSHLYRAMRKYPQSTLWSIHTLRSDITDKAELDQTERDFIKFLKATDPEYGYNICRGGEGRTGLQSREEKQKRIDSLKEMWKRPGHRETVIAKNTGKKRSPEIKAKLAKVLEYARTFLPEKQSEESNKKRSMALLGKPKPNSFGKMVSQRLLGRIIPDTVRRKISQTLKEKLKHIVVSPKAATARVVNLEKGRLEKRRRQAEQAKKPKPHCSIDGCDKVSKACGLCGAHLQRRYRHGVSLEDKPIRLRCTSSV